MFTLLAVIFEMLYWVFTGGHCLEHLATPKGSMACVFIIPLELCVEGSLLWRLII
jgi:hypothetical protein